MEYGIYYDTDPNSKPVKFFDFNFSITCFSCGDRGGKYQSLTFTGRIFNVHYGCDNCKNILFTVHMAAKKVCVSMDHTTPVGIAYIDEMKVTIG